MIQGDKNCMSKFDKSWVGIVQTGFPTLFLYKKRDVVFLTLYSYLYERRRTCWIRLQLETVRVKPLVCPWLPFLGNSWKFKVYIFAMGFQKQSILR